MFSREDTKILKGVAVLLMLFHHLAAFPERYPVGFEGFSGLFGRMIDEANLRLLAMNAQFCVPIFFFLGGYGLYMRWKAGKFHLPDAVISLYKQFWKVFVIYIPVAYVFFARTGEGIQELCTRYVIVNKVAFVTDLLANFVGYSFSLNSEWWFLPAYICALFMGLLFCILIKNQKNVYVDLFAVIVIDVLIRNIFSGLMNIPVFEGLKESFFYTKLFGITPLVVTFFEGVVFAKYDALAWMKKRIEQIPFSAAVCAAGCLAAYWCRTYVVGSQADLVYTPVFICFVSAAFDRLKILRPFFVFVGKHSTNMWLIHSFYCYYFLEATGIVYCTRSALADWLILAVMTLASSVVLELFWVYAGKIRKKFSA